MAGVIDGEGTISLYVSGGRIYPRIGVYNMDRRFCDRVHELVGSGGVTVDKKKYYRFNTSSQQDILFVLKKIKKYLIVKKKNADLVIEWLETRDFSIAKLFIDERKVKFKNSKAKNHLKGNRGNSEQHRRSALCCRNNHLKGNRTPGHHSKISKERWLKQKKLNKEFEKRCFV